MTTLVWASLGVAQATFGGFQINPFTELLGGSNGAGVSGGIRIVDGATFFVPGSLCEHRTQLDFPRVGRLAVSLALPPHRFFLDYQNSRPVYLYIEEWNRLAHNQRQFQLHRPRHFPLFSRSDILANSFRGSLDGFGGCFPDRRAVSTAGAPCVKAK